MEPPWKAAPSVQLDAGLPPARRFEAVPRELIERGRDLLGMISDHFPTSYRHLATLASLRTAHRFTAEAKGLAHHVETDWQRILVANLSYDLVLASLGCSTIALPTPDGPILARNMDWAPEQPLARASVRVDVLRDGEIIHRTANWPGGIGVVTGLSGRGFALALNAVFHPDGPDRLGYPVLLFLRRLLEDATSFDDALKRLQTQRLTTAGLFMLVGRENDERVVIERAPREAVLRWPARNEPLVATNHYQKFDVARGSLSYGLTGTSADRCASLTELLTAAAGKPIDDTRLLYALTDPAVIQSITAQHVIVHPRSNDLRLYVPRRLLHV